MIELSLNIFKSHYCENNSIQTTGKVKVKPTWLQEKNTYILDQNLKFTCVKPKISKKKVILSIAIPLIPMTLAISSIFRSVMATTVNQVIFHLFEKMTKLQKTTHNDPKTQTLQVQLKKLMKVEQFLLSNTPLRGEYWIGLESKYDNIVKKNA